MEFVLFIGVLVWLLAACVTDLRKTEIPEWLTLSLLAVGLIYKGVLALMNGGEGFALSLSGAAIFFFIGQVFYYSKVFAGGDAWLLGALGAVMPYSSPGDLAVYSIGFVLLLLFIGALYTLVYSFFIISRQSKQFRENLLSQLKKWRYNFLIAVILAGLLWLFLHGTNIISSLPIVLIAILILPWLFCYLKAVEALLIVRVKPGELQEGDWLHQEVRVYGMTLRKSIHGLQKNEIKLLKKARRAAIIQKGIPFAPAFLIAWAVMGYGAFAGLGFSELLKIFLF